MSTINSINAFLDDWNINNSLFDNGILNEERLKQFIQDLQNQIDGLAIDNSLSGTLITYSGKINDLSVWEYAEKISETSNGHYFYISDTPAGGLLKDQVFIEKMNTIFNGDTELYNRVFNGADINGEQSRFAVDNLLSLNDYVSQKTMLDYANGNVTNLLYNNSSNSVFARTELPVLLNKPSVLSINGIPKSDLINLLNSQGIEAVLDRLSSSTDSLMSDSIFYYTQDGNLFGLYNPQMPGTSIPDNANSLIAINYEELLHLKSKDQLLIDYSDLLGPQLPDDFNLFAFKLYDNISNTAKTYISSGEMISNISSLTSVEIIANTLSQLSTSLGTNFFENTSNILSLLGDVFIPSSSNLISAQNNILNNTVVQNGLTLSNLVGLQSLPSLISLPDNMFALKIIETTNTQVYLIRTAEQMESAAQNIYNSVNWLCNRFGSIESANLWLEGHNLPNISTIAQGIGAAVMMYSVGKLIKNVINECENGNEENALTMVRDWCMSMSGGFFGGMVGASIAGAIIKACAVGLFTLGPVGMAASFILIYGLSIGLFSLLGSELFSLEGALLSKSLGTIFDLFTQAENARVVRYDPLVLDMSGNGFNPTSVEDGANFDLDNNGYAERINWVQDDDVLIAVDKNGDGIINNGSELFEDGMLLNNGQLSRNGFEVLAQYDSNGDGIIDSNDVDFSQLLIWNDANGNGISETGELISLADAGIVSISLNYHTANQNTESGTLLGNVATFTKADGTSFEIAEYWVLSHHYDTIEVTDDTQGLEIPESITELPNVGCIGNLPSLHRAMLLDDSGRIEALIRRFKNSDDLLERIQMVDELLMILADVENIDPTSRGANFDARKLKILEVAMGEDFVGVNGVNPNENARTLLNTAYDRLRGAYLSELLIQCGYSMITNLLFENEDGTINSDLANMFIYYLVSEVKLFGQPLFASMLPHTMELYRNLEFVLGSDNLLQRYREMYETGLPEYATEMNMLLNSYIGTPMNDYLVGNENDNFLSGNDGNDHLEGGAGNDWISGGSGNDVIYGNDGYDMIDGEDGDDIIYGGNGGSEIYGGSGNDQISGGNETDIIYGGDGNDTIHGYAGDDELYGDDGNDSLYGGDGNDTLDGWLGNDILQGGAGNDTYLFGYGYGIDTITDSSGVNKIVFLDDITPADLYIKNEGSNNAVSICIRGTEDRLIINNFKSSAAYQNFTLEFYDGTTMALNDVNSPFVNMNLTDENENISALFAVDSTIHGNGGNDYLYGNVGNDTIFGDDGDDQIYGQSGNDTLYGGVGNDHLEGGEGDDVLDGGIGNDTLQGGAGNDTYYFGSGSNRIVFLEGITPADLYVKNHGDYAVAICIRGTTDKLILNSFRSNNHDPYRNFTLEFSDGTEMAIDSPNSPFVNMNMTEDDEAAFAYFTADTTMHGNGGNDTLYGNSGDDTIYGDDGNDYLYGNAGEDNLYGGSGDDHLYGGVADDVLYGGAGNEIGNDTLQGGAGNDTYYFGIGYGTDTISDGSGINTIVFDGLNKNELSFENGSYNSVIIRVRDTSDCLIISNYRSSDAYRNFNLIFEDCTMSMTDFEVNNDYQYNFTQPSTINDNTGNDTLTLSQNAQEVLFSNLNDNLVISSNSANAALTVSDWFDSPNNQIETIISNDGYYIMNTQIALLIDSISQFNSNNNVSWSEALSNNNSQALDIFNQFWVEQN